MLAKETQHEERELVFEDVKGIEDLIGTQGKVQSQAYQGNTWTQHAGGEDAQTDTFPERINLADALQSQRDSSDDCMIIEP